MGFQASQYAFLTGNVGIGTTSATLATLQTVGKVSATAAIFDSGGQGVGIISTWPGIGFNSYYNSGYLAINTGYGGVIGLNQTDGSMDFYTAASVTGQGTAQAQTERMRISNTGNVGIGTATPRFKLELNGQLINTTAYAANSNLGSYDVGVGSVGATTLYGYTASCTGNASGACSGAGGVVLGLANTSATVNIPNSGNTFFNGGYVGIGITAPIEPLHVHLGAGLNVGFFNSTMPSVGSFNDTFSAWGDLGVNNAVFIKSSGNVGIGNTAPIRALTLGGEFSYTTAGTTAYLNVSDAAGSNGTTKALDIRGLGSAGAAEVALSSITLNASTTYAASRMDANSNSGSGGYVSSGNYGGTGSAAYMPSGIWANGATEWIYGTVNFNGAQVDTAVGNIRDAGGGWVRTYGNTGWVSNTYGGGWFMSDATWLRSYGSKPVYMDTGYDTGAASGVACGGGLGAGYTFRVCGTQQVTSTLTVSGGLNTTGRFNLTGNYADWAQVVNWGPGSVDGYGLLVGTGYGKYSQFQNVEGYYTILAQTSNGVNTNGNVYAANFFHTSDRRAKDNIKPMAGLSVVDKLNGVTFTWKKEGTPSAGVIAQEVLPVFPEAVSKNSISGLFSVNYDALFAPVIEAIKELHTMLVALQAKFDKIAADITGHDARITKLETTVMQLQTINDNNAKEIAAMREEIKAMKSGPSKGDKP